MKKFLHPKLIREIIDYSKKEPVLIFKHSLTCPISIGAYGRIVEGLEKNTISYPIYIVIVQKNRDLSSEIAREFNVVHQSPQIILVKDGKAVYDDSYNNIQVENIPKI